MMELIFLLLPLAALSGWLLGRRSVADGFSNGPDKLSSNYYKGLNFLLDEQTDKAVEAFIKMLDASPETVETTLALGNFFRRRGEVDRAIRVHQNLIAKPNLNTKQRNQSLLELAQDYLRAGVYDRAESLLLDVTEGDKYQLETSLYNLIDIYEREKDWEKAIEVANRLRMISNNNLGKDIAHYYCELAQNHWSKGKIRVAFKFLKLGLRYDQNSVRVNLLKGQYEQQLGNYKSALKAFKNIYYQDSEFLPEVIPAIINCYQKLNLSHQLEQYLQLLMHYSPSISVAMANADQIKTNQGKQNAAQFLANFINDNPSTQGVKALVECHIALNTGKIRQQFILLKQLIDKILANRAVYKCSLCGFAAKTLLWQCPSCRKWGAVKPIDNSDQE